MFSRGLPKNEVCYYHAKGWKCLRCPISATREPHFLGSTELSILLGRVNWTKGHYNCFGCHFSGNYLKTGLEAFQATSVKRQPVRVQPFSLHLSLFLKWGRVSGKFLRYQFEVPQA